MSKVLAALDNLQKTVEAKRALYTQITGNRSAGALLAQIVYWYKPDKQGRSKLRVWSGGVPCIAKNRCDWERECGLSLDQYKDGISRLRMIGLVQVERHLFQGKITPHIILNAPQLIAILSGSTPPIHWRESHQSIGGNSTNPLVGKPPITTMITTETTSAITLACATQGQKEQEQEKAKAGGEDQEQEQCLILGQGRWMKAEDVKKKLEEAKLAQENKLHGQPLALHWLRQCALTHEGSYQKALDAKEKGQLRQVKKHVGELVMPLIDYVIPHWYEFCLAVRKATGTKSSPDQPHVGYFLAHYEIALQLIAEPVPVVEKAKPIYTHHPKYMPGQKSDEPPLTPEEIAASIAKWNNL